MLDSFQPLFTLTPIPLSPLSTPVFNSAPSISLPSVFLWHSHQLILLPYTLLSSSPGHNQNLETLGCIFSTLPSTAIECVLIMFIDHSANLFMSVFTIDYSSISFSLLINWQWIDVSLYLSIYSRIICQYIYLSVYL